MRSIKFKSICALAFGLTMAVSSSLQCSYTPYIGVSAGHMFSGSKYDLSINLQPEQYATIGVYFEDGALASDSVDDNLSFLYKESSYSLVGKYFLDFESGHSFSAKLGLESSEGVFFDIEFAKKFKKDKIKHSDPYYLDNSEQYIDTEIKSGIFNAGYFFNNSGFISPFVSLGLGIANFDLSGEVRISVGDERDAFNNYDYVDFHKKSARRGSFKAEAEKIFIGNCSAGLSMPVMGGAKMLLSYKYTTALENMDLELKKYEHNSSTHSWSGFGDPGVTVMAAKAGVAMYDDGIDNANRPTGYGKYTIGNNDYDIYWKVEEEDHVPVPESEIEKQLKFPNVYEGEYGTGYLYEAFVKPKEGLQDKAIFDGNIDWLRNMFSDHVLEVAFIIPLGK